MNYEVNVISLENLDSMFHRFHIIENNNDGDCLFESIAYHYNYWCDIKESAKQVRRQISTYYDTIMPIFNTNTCKLNQKPSLQKYICDLVELENAHSSTKHQEKIQYDGIYGSVCDLVTAAFLFQFQFELYMRCADGTFILYKLNIPGSVLTHTFYYSGQDMYQTLTESTHL